ncbi:MAG: hypothetical protein ACLFU4_03730, partial [Opitutales bacterium]
RQPGKWALEQWKEAIRWFSYYRDVLKRQLGDFSDYKQASGSQRVPVVLSVEELRRVMGQMAGPQRLMAQLQYGSGSTCMWRGASRPARSMRSEGGSALGLA